MMHQGCLCIGGGLVAVPSSVGKPSYLERCGDVLVSKPFQAGDLCYAKNTSFHMFCSHNIMHPTLHRGNFVVHNIS